MNEDAVQELISRKPELKSKRDKLAAMKAGSYCIHRSWGFGQIRDYDAGDQKLIIDFVDKPGHKMDPAFCLNTMEVLADDHILVRKQTEPEVIQEMIDKRPADLLVELLKQYPNNAATGVEVESVLTRVVGEGAFKRWWTRARREIARDPRIASPARKTGVYVLREEPVSMEEEILQDFKSTRSPRRKVGLAEKLFQAAKENADFRDPLGEVLETLDAIVRESRQLTEAERLHAAIVRDDFARLLGRDPGQLDPTTASLVAEARELPEVVAELPAAYQSRVLEVIVEAFPAEWKEVAFNLLKTSSGKFTSDCINFLLEHDLAEEILDTLKRWQTEQNLRAPLLLWIVKNRNSKRFRKIIGDLIAPRLLSSIFFAIDYEALQTAGTRRIPLAEELSDDQELITDLLAEADAETARDLANTLLLNQGFEELTKKSLLARFIKQFPTIQSLVAGEAEEREERLLVSRESHDRRTAELQEIIQKKIPENSRAIAAAREHGDLRENSEYKMAKQDQSVLLAKRAQLERELARAQVTDFQNATTDQVGIGTIVTLKDLNTGEQLEYTILGAWDSDPEKHIISYKTPLAASLLTHRIGEQVSVRIGDHENMVEIVGIRRYVDEAQG
ncbi:MAG: transcription elongation factor GreA [Verrucomicrobia bacterium]|nr:MAG: transcription elongation factor GreA [Verrucomicrobiota bacterium]